MLINRMTKYPKIFFIVITIINDLEKKNKWTNMNSCISSQEKNTLI